jgi:hypothetical protein
MLHFQALVAVSEVIQQLNEKNPNFVGVKANEPTKIVLLSLGCGAPKRPAGIDARFAKVITYDEWIPLVTLGLGFAAGDTNDYHLASVFSDLPSLDNYYLRVEVHYNIHVCI